MLAWDDIDEDELRRLFHDKKLSDGQIADLYNVTKGKVTYKRNKLGISIKNKVYEDFVKEHKKLFKKLNSDSKERLLKKENIDKISKAITYFIFRNGSIENMHAKEQFSQSDLETLNKYMVNRIGGLLTKILDNEWLILEVLLDYYKVYGSDWDEVEPDVEEINTVFKSLIPKGLK